MESAFSLLRLVIIMISLHPQDGNDIVNNIHKSVLFVNILVLHHTILRQVTYLTHTHIYIGIKCRESLYFGKEGEFKWLS